MVVPVERVHLAMAHAALPSLLPTPPYAVATALVVLLNQSPPKPCRADAMDRWDACKNTLIKSPPKPTSRADAAVRWDINKKSPRSRSTSSLTGRAPAGATPSCEKWERTKWPGSRGSPSDERWDAHKKPRPLQASGGDIDEGDDQRSTGSNDMEVEDEPQPQPQPQMGLYAGSDFPSPPEPSMVPTPSFLGVPRSKLA